MKKITPKTIVEGCNYHTKWQSDPAMRFVLSHTNLEGDKAFITTRTTKKGFWTNTSDLIFIMSDHNIQKAENILKNRKRYEFKEFS